MCPGRMPSPTAPGCISGFPQRRNGSAPAGAGSKTGMTLNRHVNAKCASVLWPSHCLSLCSLPACKALPLGKQVEPKRPTLRQPLAGGVPRPQHRRGRLRQNFPGEKGGRLCTRTHRVTVLGEARHSQAIVIKLKDLRDCLQTVQEIKALKIKAHFRGELTLASNLPISRVKSLNSLPWIGGVEGINFNNQSWVPGTAWSWNHVPT